MSKQYICMLLTSIAACIISTHYGITTSDWGVYVLVGFCAINYNLGRASK